MSVYNLDYERSVHLLLNFRCSLNQVFMGTYRDPGKPVSQMQKVFGVCPCLRIVSRQLMLCICYSYSNVWHNYFFFLLCTQQIRLACGLETQATNRLAVAQYVNCGTPAAVPKYHHLPPQGCCEIHPDAQSSSRIRSWLVMLEHAGAGLNVLNPTHTRRPL